MTPAASTTARPHLSFQIPWALPITPYYPPRKGPRRRPGGLPEASRKGPGRVQERSRGGPGGSLGGRGKSKGVLGASRRIFASLWGQLGADLGANLGALGGRLRAISAFLEGAIFEVAFHTPPGPVWEAIWVPEKVHFEPPKGLETRAGAPVHFHQKCTKIYRFLYIFALQACPRYPSKAPF